VIGIIESHQINTWNTTASTRLKEGIQKTASPTTPFLLFLVLVVVREVSVLVDDGCGCGVPSVGVPVVVLEVLHVVVVDVAIVVVVAPVISKPVSRFTTSTSATTGNCVTSTVVMPFSATLVFILFMSSLGLMSFCMIVTPEEVAGKWISYATLTAPELP